MSELTIGTEPAEEIAHICPECKREWTTLYLKSFNVTPGALICDDCLGVL